MSDPQMELLEDIRQWLEWQQFCGTDVWPVDEIDIWNRKVLKDRSRQRRRPQRSPPQRNPSSTGFLKPAEKELTANAVPRKEPSSLAGGWGQLLESRTPTIDFGQLNEVNGLNIIKEHQDAYCPSKPKCVIGGGRPANPILVIEGHTQGLTNQAKESLGKIMDNVLQISRTKMYWLPYLVDSSSCSVCRPLFKASLECLTPKLVLIMGVELQGKISLRAKNGEPKLGDEILFETNRWTIPGVWTHHPTDMVSSTALKKECMQHLDGFKRLMRKVKL